MFVFCSFVLSSLLLTSLGFSAPKGIKDRRRSQEEEVNKRQDKRTHVQRPSGGAQASGIENHKTKEQIFIPLTLVGSLLLAWRWDMEFLKENQNIK